MTTQEAAEVLGLTVRAVQKIITNKQIPAVKIGRDWFVKKEDVMKMKDNREVRRKERSTRGRRVVAPNG
jgi:excisionase family DNA binding protein